MPSAAAHAGSVRARLGASTCWVARASTLIGRSGRPAGIRSACAAIHQRLITIFRYGHRRQRRPSVRAYRSVATCAPPPWTAITRSNRADADDAADLAAWAGSSNTPTFLSHTPVQPARVRQARAGGATDSRRAALAAGTGAGRAVWAAAGTEAALAVWAVAGTAAES